MYASPIIKDGTKIYKLPIFFKRRIVIILCLAVVFSYFLIIGIGINAKSSSEIMLACAVSIMFTVFCLEFVYLAFSFQFKLTREGGTLMGLGKIVGFEWKDADTLMYVYSDKYKKAQLSLHLMRSNVQIGFRFASKNYFPIQFTDDVIPLDALYHQKSFWSLNPNREPPTQEEYSIHLRYFLQTDMGQDIIRYAPHVLSDVLHKYLPDNDLNTRF